MSNLSYINVQIRPTINPLMYPYCRDTFLHTVLVVCLNKHLFCKNATQTQLVIVTIKQNRVSVSIVKFRKLPGPFSATRNLRPIGGYEWWIFTRLVIFKDLNGFLNIKKLKKWIPPYLSFLNMMRISPIRNVRGSPYE